MKITLRSITAYALGVPIILLGILALFTNLGAAALLLTGGLLALPVVRRRLDTATGLDISGGAAAAIFLVCAVAGAGTFVLSAADTADTAPGADVSNVSVSATDANPSGATAELAVNWTSRAQSAVDPSPDDMYIYETEDGEKYLVVRMHITNTGSQDIELTPQLFQFESSGVIYEYQALFGSGQGLSGVTLTPGADYTGWTVFAIPSETTDGTLAVTFEHDPEMAVNMSD